MLNLLPDLTDEVLVPIHNAGINTRLGSPLHVAASKGQADFIRRFLDEKRVNFDQTCSCGWSIRHLLYIVRNDGIRALISEGKLPGPEDTPDFGNKRIMGGPKIWELDLNERLNQFSYYSREISFGLEASMDGKFQNLTPDTTHNTRLIIMV